MTADSMSVGEVPRKDASIPWVKTTVTVAALGLCGLLIHRVAQAYSLQEVVSALYEIPGHRLGLAGLAAAASYGCLTMFDALALRYAGARVPYPYVALTSFTSLSLGHTLGFAALSSGAIRYRFYARKGVSVAQLARIIAFCGMTVMLGLATVAGVALVLGPSLAADYLEVGPALARAIGAACLMLPMGYVALCAGYRGTVRAWRWSFKLPSWRIALAQCAIGGLNYAFVSACLYQALAGLADVGYPSVAAAYVLGNLASLVSHVPGGIGVLESVVLVLLPGAKVVGALVAFRVAYYLIPLALGAVTLAITELYYRGRSA